MSNSPLKSASSGQPIALVRKLDEAVKQFLLLWRDRGPFSRRDFREYERDFAEYEAIVKNFGGFRLQNAQVFEIGCGQRPYRLCWLLANNVQCTGIDMDRVVFTIDPKSALEIAKHNGVERTLKTVLRYFVFDIRENKQFQRALSNIARKPFQWPIDAIVQGDACETRMWPKEKVDFIYSEDVFEHIPKDALRQLCKQIAKRLTDRGIAMVRPMVFTGIQGGHNVEYYDLSQPKNRKCPPWDHLREHNFPANTYLNRLSLAEYRTIFSEHLDIVDELVIDKKKGAEFMTSELRQELASWSDEELFSNHVRFVLRKKR